ncbi:glycosyltransferase [Natronoglomus mannanivorans]|uniref:Glycosyltransferase n=1 Tax=Natronoglomus mannanivorans TaxID=2979990 RepID=A0AAP2Z026_9EURY|nr:glycosyltransferase [Halobacteria archaeon AArc-xg1-1]
MSTLADAVVALSWLFLVYFVVANLGYYLPSNLAGFAGLLESVRKRKGKSIDQLEESPFLPGIAIVTPAYNESELILDSVSSFLDTEYPNAEVVVVNDGSTDDTLDKLRAEFDLQPTDESVPDDAPCQRVRTIYRAETVPLVVVDKVNGGIGDAQNAGIWVTDKPLVCIADADTLLNRRGLHMLVRPFLERPDETVATGGIIHALNAFEFEHGEPVAMRVPSQVVRFQVVEYFRTFYLNRIGMTRLGCLHLISGAVGLFRTDLVREINGYNRVRNQHSEDLDLTLRMHKYMKRSGEPYRIAFVPDPVAWTDFPNTIRQLGHQRRLWFEGLLQVFALHRPMIGRKRYGLVGLFALPGLLFIEGLGRLTEAVGYVVVGLAFLTGFLNIQFFTTFLLLSVGLGIFISWIGILSDVLTFKLYDQPREVLRLLVSGIFEPVGFRQVWSLLSLPAIRDYLRDDTDWAALVDDSGRFASLSHDAATGRTDGGEDDD